jgi:hypothetical protein
LTVRFAARQEAWEAVFHVDALNVLVGIVLRAM